MAKIKCSLVKKSAAAPKKLSAGANLPVLTDLNIMDVGNGNFLVLGTDQGGNQTDISAVATLAATSSDATVATTAVTGMTFSLTPATPVPAVGATCTITLVVTFTDGSVGPFTVNLPCAIQASPISGVVVVPGTPTVV